MLRLTWHLPWPILRPCSRFSTPRLMLSGTATSVPFAATSATWVPTLPSSMPPVTCKVSERCTWHLLLRLFLLSTPQLPVPSEPSQPRTHPSRLLPRLLSILFPPRTSPPIYFAAS